MNRRVLLGMASALALAAPAFAQTPDNDTLVIAQSIDAPTMDPADIGSRNASNVAGHIFGSLYTRVEGGIAPYFATSYTEAEDGLSHTYALRDDLTCHDGEVLNAEDVAYSFNRAADEEQKFTGNTPGYIYSSVGFAGAEAVDDLTVKINFTKYNPIAAGMLTEVYVHCKDSYEAMSRDEASQTPVGSGPYKFVEWVKDDKIVLERWDDFPLEAPTFKTLVWRVVPEASTRTAELISGNVDVITNVSPDQIDTVNASGAAEVQVIEGLRRIYIGFNQKAKFQDTDGGKAITDSKVRWALQYAVDIPAICENLLAFTCTRATGPVNPPGDNTSLEPVPYDPELAEKLLDEAGYPRGDDGVRFSLKIQSPNGRYINDGQIAQVIGQMLTDIGVETEVELLDFSSAFVPLIRAHDAGPLFLLGSGGGIFSPLADLMDFSAQDAGTNYTEWKDDEFFGLWDDIAATRDPEEQAAVAQKMLKIFYERSPWLLMYFQPDYYGVSSRLDWQAPRDERIDVTSASPK
ncbi:ABC transporter substrate-binding protein [Primorskyibacter sedentarius]|uniref:ABC transporter substrate-binding protein n=1 Tax=Primorskyibacter sedentarius TaxID=745311 RepID=UPI003EC058BC